VVRRIPIGNKELVLGQEENIKFYSLIDTQSQKVEEFGILTPQSTDSKTSFGGNIQDLLATFGANFERETKNEYILNRLIRIDNPQEIKQKGEVKEDIINTHIADIQLRSPASQVLFTNQVLEPDKINVEISSIENKKLWNLVVTLKTKLSRWLHEWTFSYHLSELHSRYKSIAELYVLMVESYQLEATGIGVNGFDALTKLAKNQANVTLITSNSIKREQFFSLKLPDNFKIKTCSDEDYFNLSKEKLIIVDNREAHAEIDGENVYTNDSIKIKEFKHKFDNISLKLNYI
jgi:hypothetical protein